MKRKSLKRLDPLIRPLHAEGLNDQSIAERIGCPRRYVCTRRRAMGLAVNYERHTWRVKPVTGRDDTIRAMHAEGKLDRDIAKAIGVGKRSVSLRRVELGLKTLNSDPATAMAPFDDVIRVKLSLGWSDAEIADVIPGADRRQVGYRRTFLGLPASGNSPRRRAKVAAKTREQLQRMGLPSMASLRVEAHKAFARDRGWPDDLGPRAVQILEVLFERGLMHRRQIVEAIGMNPDRPQKNWLFDSKNETSYLGTLMKRGFVVRAPKLILPGMAPGKRKMVGRGVHFYGLTPKARTMKEHWNDTQISAAGRQLAGNADGSRRNRTTRKGRVGKDHGPRSRRDHRSLQNQSQSRA